jgi:MFS family permease
MLFRPQETLTEAEITNGLKAVIKDGLASQAMGVLTGGVFLVAFALQLGASNFVIGLLASIPALSQLIQIPSVYIIERIRNRKLITVVSSLISRLSLLFIVALPFLVDQNAAIIIFVSALCLHTIFASISGCSWSSWMHDLVPHEKLGEFFSKRMAIAIIFGIVLSVMAGGFIDYWKQHYPSKVIYGYVDIFFLGFIAGIIGLYYLLRIPEPKMEPLDGKVRFLDIILQPLKDVNFKKLISFLASWNFAVNLAAPFFTVYMIKRLGLSLSYVIGFTVLSQVANVLFLQLWGRFSDRFSNKSVLRVSGPLFMFSILCWPFTTLPDKYFLTIPLLIFIHIVMGISLAGVALASSNIVLKLAPRGKASSYLAANSFFSSMAAGIAPMIGGKFIDVFSKYELSWVLSWRSPEAEVSIQTLNLQSWDFFFIFAFIIGLYSIHRLTDVQEVGEAGGKIVTSELLAEIRRPLRNLSTVGGLRNIIQFPFILAYEGIKTPHKIIKKIRENKSAKKQNDAKN